jgi:hypothetical protein
MSRRRGVALGTVLMVAALATLAALTMAGSSVFHLRFQSRMTALQAARNEADTALADVVDRVIRKTEYGQDNQTCKPKLRQGAERVVTFDPNKARDEDVLCSYNNLPKSLDDPAPPPVAWPPGTSQYTIPPGAVLVASRATVDGVTARGIAIVWFPIYPHAIAASGPVTSKGPLLVAGTDKKQPKEALANPNGKANLGGAKKGGARNRQRRVARRCLIGR